MADTTGSTSTNCLQMLSSFVKTQKGLILAAEIVLSFFILICFCISVFGGYFIIPTFEMVYAAVIFIVFMMGLDKQVTGVNWVWKDLFRAATGGLVYIIMSLICVISWCRVQNWYWDKASLAGGVLGFFAGILFAYDTYTICMQIQRDKRQRAALGNNTV